MFGTLADFDELIAGLHERGMKLVMDLVVNHTSDEHPWFVESRSTPRQPEARLVLVAPARDGRAGATAPSRTTGSSFFSGPAWELDEATASTTCTCSRRKQPDLNWENPEVREAVYAMMRWWLDRGVDGFRMDVINMISKDPALPDGSPGAGRRRLGDGVRDYVNGPRIHEFLQEMHREVFAGRAATLLTVGEMPGVTVEEAAASHRPRPRARSTWSSSSSTSASTSAGATSGTSPTARPARPQGARSAAGRTGSPRPAGTRSTGTTTTSRAPCPASATTAPSTGSPRPSCSARCCTCTAGRRTSTRARSSA